MTRRDGERWPFQPELFIEVLRARMNSSGTSRHALAQVTGIPRNTIIRILRGQLPGVVEFGRLVQWLGVPADAFFGETELSVAEEELDVATALRNLRRALEASGVPTD